MNIANLLTILRFPMTIGCIILIFINTPISILFAVILFILASITDTLDGVIARRHNIVSDQGKILDPIADKFLTLGVFLSFAIILPTAVNLWLVIIIMVREISITGIRLYYLDKGVVISAKILGKVKTVSQVVIIIYVFFVYFVVLTFPLPPNYEIFMLFNITPILMWYIVFITVLSGITALIRVFRREKTS